MTDKIARKDAEEALRFIWAFASTEVGRAAEAAIARGADAAMTEDQVSRIHKALAILRRCRIVEPGGLDAETWLEARKAVAALLSNEESLTGAINVSTWHEVMDYMRARADTIEKGE